MITDYLNQVVAYQQYLNSTDEHGDKDYAATQNIKARKRTTSVAVTTAHGELINARFIIHTETAVQVGDLLDGQAVVSISELVNYAGVTIGTVAYT
jgi:hypothetical protein